MRLVVVAASSFVVLLMQGCASVTTGGSHDVAVEAIAADRPVAGAHCEASNDKGRWSVVTPGTVNVRGSYGDLTVRCESDQYEPGIATYKSSTKAMAFGNVLVGGLIGATIDVASGAAYQYPSMVSVALGQPTGKPASSLPAVDDGKVSVMRPGDFWEYRIEDRFTGTFRSVRWSVDALDGDRASMNAGSRSESLSSGAVSTVNAMAGDLDSLEPPQGWGRPDLRLGQVWDLSYQAADGLPRSELQLRARVVRRERVRVPAGTFDTLVVEHEGMAHRVVGSMSIGHRAKFTAWIDQVSRRVVKFESDVWASGGSQATRVSRERAELSSMQRAGG